MKIAVTVVTFSKNDEVVKELKKYFPNVSINTLGRRYTEEELINALKDTDGAIVGLDKIDENILKHCPRLKVISKHGIGLDKINFDDLKKYDVEFKYKEGVNKRSVAELTLGMILGLVRGLYKTSLQMKEGIWNKYNSEGRKLTGKTIGIIGVGNIGKELVKLLKPFNCKILVNDIRKDEDQIRFYEENNLVNSSKETIYKESDIITIHTPLTELTKNLITKEKFMIMKPDSFIINTARGEIVNEEDLLWALKNKIIAGAGLDVYAEEPPQNSELLNLKNVFCTPHIGGTSKEAAFALGLTAINSLKEYFNVNDEKRA